MTVYLCRNQTGNSTSALDAVHESDQTNEYLITPKTMFDGNHRCLRPVSDVQLGEDGADVVSYSAW